MTFRRPRVMRVSARQIQIFVAGALALMGFHSLIWTPYYFIVAKDLVFAFGSILSGLALWIGTAVLIESERAIFWAWIYLLLGILSGIVAICLSVFPILPKPLPISWWRDASDTLTLVILFSMLAWSRSERFHQTPNSRWIVEHRYTP